MSIFHSPRQGTYQTEAQREKKVRRRREEEADAGAKHTIDESRSDSGDQGEERAHREWDEKEERMRIIMHVSPAEKERGER